MGHLWLDVRYLEQGVIDFFQGLVLLKGVHYTLRLFVDRVLVLVFEVYVWELQAGRLVLESEVAAHDVVEAVGLKRTFADARLLGSA